MKPLSEIIKREQHQSSLPQLFQNTSEKSNEISVYKGALATQVVIENVAKIKFAFPSLPPEFYDVLSERLKAHGFSNERLKDAVAHVIDTCHYPTPTIADFISFDQKFKVLTYAELLKKGDELGHEIHKDYKPIQLPGRTKPVWAHIDDIKNYKLELYKTKEK